MNETTFFNKSECLFILSKHTFKQPFSFINNVYAFGKRSPKLKLILENILQIYYAILNDLEISPSFKESVNLILYIYTKYNY